MQQRLATRRAVDRTDVGRPDDQRPPSRPASSTARPTTPATADLAAVHLRLDAVATGLSSPVAIAFRDGPDRRKPCTSPSRAERCAGSSTVKQRESPSICAPTSACGNEQGFLGAAFSPDGKRLYVDYTDADGDTNVDEYTMQR